MPWKIVEEDGKYWVVKETTGEHAHKKPYSNRAKALAFMKALYANVGFGDSAMKEYQSKR